MSALPLRVLHTESSLGWGGQENRTLNEMRAMRELRKTLDPLGILNPGKVLD